jgi:hypothetical protein
MNQIQIEKIILSVSSKFFSFFCKKKKFMTVANAQYKISESNNFKMRHLTRAGSRLCE